MTPNQRGALYMVLGMGGFAVEDTFIKLAASRLPPGQILLTLGLGGMLVFWAVAWRKGLTLLSRRAFHPAVLGRNLCEMGGTFGYVLAVAFSPLTTATAVFQAAPLATTMGAALFLGEPVGWRRWLAILAGFLGVLIVVRPGTDGFVPASLFGLLAVLALSGRDLFTRRIPSGTDTVLLTGWGFTAVGVVGALQLLVTGGAMAPAPVEWGWLAVALAAGAIGYWWLTEATRIGEIAAIMPFRYARLLFALILGAAVFGERPDAWAVVGMAVVVASGLYAFARERVRAREAARASLAAMQGLDGAQTPGR